MSHYWESHKKYFDGKRLSWHGDDANEGFWASYWQQTLSASFYENLKSRKLSGTVLGKILQQEIRLTDHILEAGCGAGSWVAILKSHGFTNAQGIDYSRDLTNHINRIAPELDIQWGDALNIQVQNEHFDAYLSFGVVEHRFDGPEPFLREAFRVLKRGGKAVFTVPCVGPLRKFKANIGKYQDNTDGISFFQYGFQQHEFKKLLTESGFHVQSCRYFELDRLLLEELKIYRTLSRYNSIRFFQKHITRLLDKIDGHMLLVVCVKP